MKKFAAFAIFLGIVLTAASILKFQYDKTPLSLAKTILSNPEPLSNIEVFYIENVSLINNQLEPNSVKEKLNELSYYLKETGLFKTLTIEGHTDKESIEARNKVLSLELANAVKFYLKNNYKLSHQSIKTRGLGSTTDFSLIDPKSLVVITIRR